MSERRRLQWGVAPRLAVTVLLTVGVAALAAALIPFMVGLPPATCVETGCFCEPPAGVVPEQLVAALSSLVFVVLGLWAALGTVPPSKERTLIPLAGLAIVFIGASSFVYHATLTFVGQFLDIFSMYTFGWLLALGALWRSGRLSGRASVMWFVGLSVVLGVVQAVYPDARRILFALLLLPGVILELTPRVTGHPLASPRVRWVYGGLATMVVAYVIWVLDQTPVLCNPAGFAYGHAVWHALGAVAAYFVTRHYRSTLHPPAPPP